MLFPVSRTHRYGICITETNLNAMGFQLTTAFSNLIITYYYIVLTLLYTFRFFDTNKAKTEILHNQTFKIASNSLRKEPKTPFENNNCSKLTKSAQHLKLQS